MILLVGHGHPTMVRYAGRPIGRLVQPRSYGAVRETAVAGFPWAADNDAFNDGFDPVAFERMLGQIAGLPGCLFVVAPDVVADRAATDLLWREWAPRIRAAGLPPAYVLQDGEDNGVPWDELGSLFVGGSTDFKLGVEAERTVAEAKRRGKWVHMGRVNSRRRARYAKEIGCDSIDGTSFSMFPDRWIPVGLEWVSELAQGRMEV